MTSFTAVKVFSASQSRERETLGERVSAWLKDHPELTPVETVVRQSSDQEYHCVSIAVFLSGDPTTYLKTPVAVARSASVPVRPRPLTPIR